MPRVPCCIVSLLTRARAHAHRGKEERGATGASSQRQGSKNTAHSGGGDDNDAHDTDGPGSDDGHGQAGPDGRWGAGKAKTDIRHLLLAPLHHDGDAEWRGEGQTADYGAWLAGVGTDDSRHLLSTMLAEIASLRSKVDHLEAQDRLTQVLPPSLFFRSLSLSHSVRESLQERERERDSVKEWPIESVRE